MIARVWPGAIRTIAVLPFMSVSSPVLSFLDLSHSFEMTAVWFEMTAAWSEIIVLQFEVTALWFEVSAKISQPNPTQAN